MKIYISCLILFVILFSGCSIIGNNSSNQTQSVQQNSPGPKASLTLTLATSNPSFSLMYKSKDMINISSNLITGASITLTGPGYTNSTNWAAGQTFNYTFQALSLGNYNLKVTDWDSMGDTNSAGAVLDIANGYNYTVSIIPVPKRPVMPPDAREEKKVSQLSFVQMPATSIFAFGTPASIN